MFGTDKDGVVGDSTASAPPYFKRLLEDEGAVVTEIAFLSGKLESAIADGKLLREQILDCEKRIVKGIAARAKLEVLYESCKTKADLAEGALEKASTLTLQLEELGRANLALRHDIEKMNHELEDKEASLQRMTGELSALQGQMVYRELSNTEIVEPANTSNEAAHKRMSELERDVARLSTQKTAAMAENLVLRDNVWRKSNEISALHAQLEFKNNEVSELQARLEFRNNEISELQARFEFKNNEVSELQTRLEFKNNEMSEISAELQQVPWRAVSVYRKCRRFIPLSLLKLAGRGVKVSSAK